MALIDTIIASSPEEIKAAKAAYKDLFMTTLQWRVDIDTSVRKQK